MLSHFFKNRPYAKTGLLAIPMLLCIISMGKYVPGAGLQGFDSFMVAFEFAQTPGDIQKLFLGKTSETLSQIDVANYIDFVFMLVYALFLFEFMRTSIRLNRRNPMYFVLVLPVLVFFCDLLENLQLLGITRNFGEGSDNSALLPYLDWLQIFTWMKWEALAVTFVIISLLIFRRDLFSKVVAVIGLIPLVLSFKALSQSPQAINNFTNSIFMVFGVLVIYSFFYRSRQSV